MTINVAPGPWPKKTREMHNHHMDSTVWNDLVFRDDDIVVATWAKSGTTWTQQIVTQLVFNGAEDIDLTKVSPWLDMRVAPREERLAAVEAQTHRRVIKTHLPLDALVFSPRAKYVYVARDGRDVVWSMYNHHANATDTWFDVINETPGLVGPPIERVTASVRDYFNTWLERDGCPWWPYWEHIRGWWAIRNLPNVLLLHYADLKADLPGEIRRVADFVDIAVDDERWPAIVEHCSFDYMKSRGDALVTRLVPYFDKGAKTFINKGTNGRWRDTLSADESRRYEETALRELGEECAAWLARGHRGTA